MRINIVLSVIFSLFFGTVATTRAADAPSFAVDYYREVIVIRPEDPDAVYKTQELEAKSFPVALNQWPVKTVQSTIELMVTLRAERQGIDRAALDKGNETTWILNDLLAKTEGEKTKRAPTKVALAHR